MKDQNDTATREIIPQKIERRGGWREGSGRKKTAFYETKMFRADTRLSGIIETLKARLKNGAINEEDLKRFEELAAN